MLMKIIKIAIGTCMVITLFMIIITILIMNIDNRSIEKNKPVPTSTIKPKPTYTLITYDLGNGNYIAGKDFKEGTYDITISGVGNFSANGIDLIGPAEAKNIRLSKGETLKAQAVSGNIVIHMVKVAD